MAIIWLIMLVASLGLTLFTDPAASVNAMITGAHSAVELSLNLMALYAFWLGFFALIERLGLSRGLERLLRPVIKRLFPSSDTETRKYITMNVSANLLGLGNAATPMAINAIKRMDTGGMRATTDMIMLTVISATSLQLLPTTVIGMRATAGSANPSDFLFPSLIATVLSTLIGIIGVKICSKIFDRKKPAEPTTAPALFEDTESREPRRKRALRKSSHGKAQRHSKRGITVAAEPAATEAKR